MKTEETTDHRLDTIASMPHSLAFALHCSLALFSTLNSYNPSRHWFTSHMSNMDIMSMYHYVPFAKFPYFHSNCYLIAYWEFRIRQKFVSKSCYTPILSNFECNLNLLLAFNAFQSGICHLVNDELTMLVDKLSIISKPLDFISN